MVIRKLSTFEMVAQAQRIRERELPHLVLRAAYRRNIVAVCVALNAVTASLSGLLWDTWPWFTWASGTLFLVTGAALVVYVVKAHNLKQELASLRNRGSYQRYR